MRACIDLVEDDYSLGVDFSKLERMTFVGFSSPWNTKTVNPRLITTNNAVHIF
ncbi:unnamed protein product [Acanthoscelides obtectus]|uniref:Uncharacterized protein n=1 Tax=Acanthoscelides obtectus TaxID=200917 RepID=A0A9P0LZY1_ACAOB|nr:unnamed protein product [Acanthoscelides obtectus]CAK1647530.1 hypothetical protein AOBTE_LOCUS15251 [Acanthoscelides obtectus]